MLKRRPDNFSSPFSDSEDCKQCPRVLAEIEHIDDEADGAGIDFVKIDDREMAKEAGVFALPAIVFYKRKSKEPVIYAGDLYDEEGILNWLLTQKNPSGDVIEDLEGKKLKKLIEESPAIAVYFCKSWLRLKLYNCFLYFSHFVDWFWKTQIREQDTLRHL